MSWVIIAVGQCRKNCRSPGIPDAQYSSRGDAMQYRNCCLSRREATTIPRANLTCISQSPRSKKKVTEAVVLCYCPTHTYSTMNVSLSAVLHTVEPYSSIPAFGPASIWYGAVHTLSALSAVVRSSFNSASLSRNEFSLSNMTCG